MLRRISSDQPPAERTTALPSRRPFSGPPGGALARRVTALAASLAFVGIWASGYIVGNLATRAASPFTVLFWRFALATSIMLAVALGTRAPWPARSAWPRLAAVGVLLQTVQFGGVYLGLRLGVSAGLTSLLVCASPLAITALSWPIFGEPIDRIRGIGLGLGIAGVLAAVGAEVGGHLPLPGLLAVLAGTAGFVAGTLLQKGIGRQMDLRTGSAVQMIAATVTVLPLTLLFDGVALPRTAAAIGTTVWLAVVNSIGGFTLLFVLLSSRTGAAATSALFLVPPVTALVAVPVLGQPVSLGALLGIVLSGAGVLLVSRTQRRRA